MRSVAEFMLRLIYELQDQVAKARSFAFNADIEEISTTLSGNRAAEAVSAVLYAIPPGYYATDLGNSLDTFFSDHLDAVTRGYEKLVPQQGTVLQRILHQRVVPGHIKLEPLVLEAGRNLVEGDAEGLHALAAAVVALCLRNAGQREYQENAKNLCIANRLRHLNVSPGSNSGDSLLNCPLRSVGNRQLSKLSPELKKSRTRVRLRKLPDQGGVDQAALTASFADR
jgi:hypothetical protein